MPATCASRPIRAQLKLVLRNLILNSAQAIDGRGEMQLAARSARDGRSCSCSTTARASPRSSGITPSSRSTRRSIAGRAWPVHRAPDHRGARRHVDARIPVPAAARWPSCACARRSRRPKQRRRRPRPSSATCPATPSRSSVTMSSPVPPHVIAASISRTRRRALVWAQRLAGLLRRAPRRDRGRRSAAGQRLQVADRHRHGS